MPCRCRRELEGRIKELEAAESSHHSQLEDRTRRAVDSALDAQRQAHEKQMQVRLARSIWKAMGCGPRLAGQPSIPRLWLPRVRELQELRAQLDGRKSEAQGLEEERLALQQRVAQLAQELEASSALVDQLRKEKEKAARCGARGTTGRMHPAGREA